MRDGAPRLQAVGLDVSYGSELVLDGVEIVIAPAGITALVGPNGSGKSTLLRALGRLLEPRSGVVMLDGGDIRRRPTRSVARELGLLPQGPQAPDGLTVEDLVARGRFPHRGLLSAFSREDREQVEVALGLTGMDGLRGRLVEELSGGQRQRAWIAMALAQDTPTMLLDEPTTYLDLAHRVEVLDLLWDLNRERGRTIVLVLHDLNEAGRYADRIIALADGRIRADGTPEEVLSAETIRAVFGQECRVLRDPETGTPLVVPAGGPGRSGAAVGRALRPAVA